MRNIAQRAHAVAFAASRVEYFKFRTTGGIFSKVLQLPVLTPTCKEALEHHSSVLGVLRMTIAFLGLISALLLHATIRHALGPCKPVVVFRPGNALANVYPVWNERSELLVA